MADSDITAKKRKYSPSKVTWQVDKACSRTTLNLSLAFICFWALKERLVMKSDAELVCFLLDRQAPNTCSLLVPACLIIDFSIKTNVIFLCSLLCRYKQYRYMLYFWWRWVGRRGLICVYKLQQTNAADSTFKVAVISFLCWQRAVDVGLQVCALLVFTGCVVFLMSYCAVCPSLPLSRVSVCTTTDTPGLPRTDGRGGRSIWCLQRRRKLLIRQTLTDTEGRSF